MVAETSHSELADELRRRLESTGVLDVSLRLAALNAGARGGVIVDSPSKIDTHADTDTSTEGDTHTGSSKSSPTEDDTHTGSSKSSPTEDDTHMGTGSNTAASNAEPAEPYGLLARTIASASYRVTDAQVAAVRQAAGSDKAAFEVVMSASVGAGLARWYAAARAIREATDATS
jgi:hypothetical protein